MRLDGRPDHDGRIGVSEEYRDPVRELEDQMRAANSLIEALEGEVASLRRDLERAGGALRAAREEVAARGTALEDLQESERLRTAAEEEARALSYELNDLRQQSADEQLRLRNKHIVDMAALRSELEEQRRADVAAAGSEGKTGALREEFRKERAAIERRHEAEVEELKRAAERWEEKLRDGYRSLQERHEAEIEELRGGHAAEVEALRDEIETLHRGVEGQKIDLERALREEMERAREEELRAEGERHAAELHALRSAAAERELELQKELGSAIEGHRAEVEALRLELGSETAAAEEKRKEDIKEIKRLAEGRERELRRAHQTRLSEEREAAERRINALKAQREADLSTLRARQAEELAEARRDLQERLDGLKARGESEARAYGERLRELERARLLDKKASEEIEEELAEAREERARLEQRVAELQELLAEPEAASAATAAAPPRETARDGGEARDEYRRENDERGRAEDRDADREADRTAEHHGGAAAPGEDRETPGAAGGSPEEASAPRPADVPHPVGERRPAEPPRVPYERPAVGREAREEDPGGVSAPVAPAPELRLREGVSLFNESEHPRTVASISKALGLPKVHIGIGKVDGEDGDSPSTGPVVTFVWGDLAWRRYVSDAAGGAAGARVYLIGAGDDPSDLREGDREPNARADARGRLIMGVPTW